MFQKRQNGSQDFIFGWSDYKAGFVNLSGEFCLGLDKMHRLSEFSQNVLRVSLMDFNGAERYPKYGTFSVADKSEKYRAPTGDFSDKRVRILIESTKSLFSLKLIATEEQMQFFQSSVFP